MVIIRSPVPFFDRCRGALLQPDENIQAQVFYHRCRACLAEPHLLPGRKEGKEIRSVPAGVPSGKEGIFNENAQPSTGRAGFPQRRLERQRKPPTGTEKPL